MSDIRVHPLSWLLSNNRLEEVCGTLTTGTFSSRLLLSNQDKGCTPSVAHSLPLPLGPALLNLWNIIEHEHSCVQHLSCKFESNDITCVLEEISYNIKLNKTRKIWFPTCNSSVNKLLYSWEQFACSLKGVKLFLTTKAPSTLPYKVCKNCPR